jgi:hypothetical protein
MELFDRHWDLNTWQYRTKAELKASMKLTMKKEDERTPLAMQFARLVIILECGWCVGDDSERECRRQFRMIHEQFGQDRVAFMYAASKTPWRKWPREEFWPSPTASEIEADRESTALDMAEEET